jgi:hypothetical protein
VIYAETVAQGLAVIEAAPLSEAASEVGVRFATPTSSAPRLHATVLRYMLHERASALAQIAICQPRPRYVVPQRD